MWLTTSRELHEFKEEHFSNEGGGVLSSVVTLSELVAAFGPTMVLLDLTL